MSTAPHPADPTPPASRLPATTLTTTPGEPVDAFLLIPFGEVQVERPLQGDGFVFTRRHAESALRWFERMNRKLAIDYEHQSLETVSPRSDGLRPAAGWIGGLEIRDDGLWAVKVTWTARAHALLRSGEYRYFSPVIYWTDEDQQDIAALGPVALTNDPAMHGVAPLAARRVPTDDLAAKLVAAQCELAVLKRQLVAQEADAFVERGLRQGKIVAGTLRDWRDDFLRDPDAAVERLERAPVVLPPGRVLALDRRGDVAPLPVTERAATEGGAWGIEAEDLAAFEQAAAAGRVAGGNLSPQLRGA